MVEPPISTLQGIWTSLVVCRSVVDVSGNGSGAVHKAKWCWNTPELSSRTNCPRVFAIFLSLGLVSNRTAGQKWPDEIQTSFANYGDVLGAATLIAGSYLGQSSDPRRRLLQLIHCEMHSVTTAPLKTRLFWLEIATWYTYPCLPGCDGGCLVDF